MLLDDAGMQLFELVTFVSMVMPMNYVVVESIVYG